VGLGFRSASNRRTASRSSRTTGSDWDGVGTRRRRHVARRLSSIAGERLDVRGARGNPFRPGPRPAEETSAIPPIRKRRRCDDGERNQGMPPTDGGRRHRLPS